MAFKLLTELTGPSFRRAEIYPVKAARPGERKTGRGRVAGNGNSRAEAAPEPGPPQAQPSSSPGRPVARLPHKAWFPGAPSMDTLAPGPQRMTA